ncbi:calmodulin-binding transcription activator 4-like [Ananas comosus]|uniref:Calmodulin-binding transcription activator 4-like n=1 Tax=Ananas comosus TaxID=4615 RepID=A0A6P5FFF1_ANACO|nr:calmodulin-binding transcription activator 4-like [Ananas comosus]
MLQGLDADKLHQEAKTRWLKPIEVLTILQNHEGFKITDKNPDRPPSGSLFLFNRRVLRNFRMDGHSWRRKGNGKTIAEAHERLKIANNDVLNCYYARGEENSSFQRRSYWMLDPAYSHIVLVHYREVEGENIPGLVFNLSNESFSNSNQDTSRAQVHNFPRTSELTELYQNSGSNGTAEEVNSHLIMESFETSNTFDWSETFDLPFLPEVDESIQNSRLQWSSDNEINYDYKDFVGQMPSYDIENKNQQDLGLSDFEIKESSEETFKDRFNEMRHKKNGHAEEAIIDIDSGLLMELNQLESTLRTCSSFEMPQKQWFHIREVSPECAFSSERTKVIIIGDFLWKPPESKWAVSFGDVEVPLEIIQQGVIRCHAPQHIIGKVNLFITNGNGEQCSEGRELVFLSKPGMYSSSSTYTQEVEVKSREEQLLLLKLVKLLFGENIGALTSRHDNNSEFDPVRNLTDIKDQSTSENTMDSVVQELLKDKFEQWLRSKKIKENSEQDCLLSKQDQCIIHMISGLGYAWALKPILNSGVSINYRDTLGWTALHWAAHFGREKMVAALLAAGASAGAVSHSTSQDPVGKTPASIASSNSHKGLAGYLSEAELTSHLYTLATRESEISKCSDIAVDTISQRSAYLYGGSEDQLSLKDSLEAVRNATQAAARIQAAFRAYSFRKRLRRASLSRDEFGISLEDIHEISHATKSFRAYHGDPKFEKAALSIQTNYRCWKGRKEFLTTRKHVVKIQAHVRGRQARKHYKEFLSTVSILEKVVLRWHRRGVGLRVFHGQLEPMDKEDEDDILKAFRKQKVDASHDKAISRVISMVKSPEARQQYRRMLERYQQAKDDLADYKDQGSDNHEAK